MIAALTPGQRAQWHSKMRDGRRNAYMARYAMPRELRPTFALLARTDFMTARMLRTTPDLHLFAPSPSSSQAKARDEAPGPDAPDVERVSRPVATRAFAATGGDVSDCSCPASCCNAAQSFHRTIAQDVRAGAV